MSTTRRIPLKRARKAELRPSSKLLKAIGSNIRHYRKLRRLKQREIDGLARLSMGYTSELERGKQNPTIAVLEAVASALKVTEADLVKRPPSGR